MNAHAFAAGDETMKLTTTIQFYLPYHRDGVASIPSRPADYWQWLLDHPAVAEGKYAWTLQTFLWLHQAGLPCRIVEDFPSSGVVISHRDFLPVFLRPHPDVFLICIKADRNMHPWSQFHVVQNELDPLRRSPGGARRSAAMLHWPQPGLLKRNSSRGERVQNIAYFGRPMNLDAQLRDPAWAEGLQGLGFTWLTPERPQWHDYRDVDVTVSVRNFSGQPETDNPVLNVDSKPASKLVNSWMAGVPAIVGREPAYRQVRTSGLDFIEAGSAEELREALVELRDNPTLYRDMRENGLERAREFAPETITAQWKQLFEDVVSSHHASWFSRSRMGRNWVACYRSAAYFSKPQHLKTILAALRRSSGTPAADS